MCLPPPTDAHPEVKAPPPTTMMEYAEAHPETFRIVTSDRDQKMPVFSSARIAQLQAQILTPEQYHAETMQIYRHFVISRVMQRPQR
jgi:hypothetical protein